MIIMDLYSFLVSESEHHFSGWDFTYIGDRVVNAPLTWSYSSIIIPLLKNSKSLLDMGTGGGEFLASLFPLPKYTCATEAYKPNLSLAKEKLEPLGVSVYYSENDNHLPFEDDQFDLVINRHESFSVKEVHRILKPNGVFVTQQVGDKNDCKLRLALTESEKLDDDTEWNLMYAENKLKDTGFEILIGHEDVTSTRIFDVGAMVYYLKVVPWELPNFSVDQYYSKLLALHQIIAEKGFLELKNNNHRFIIKARKIL
jgi:SAM-dependent methyltransferase